MATARVEGLRIGLRHAPSGAVEGQVVHVQRRCAADGPAENAYVYIDLTQPGAARGRYLSWVNLFDIENAGRHEPSRWSLSEPPVLETLSVRWLPFGWGDPPFPNVADA